MALIKCHECGNETSTTAASCPKCGAKPAKTSLFAQFTVGVVLLFFGLWMFSGLKGGDKSSSQAIDPQYTAPKPLQAEDMVTLKDAAFACLTKDQLYQAVGHAARHEETKFKAMFSGFECIVAPPSETFKILHVEGDVVELVNVKSGSASGMWADRSFVAR